MNSFNGQPIGKAIQEFLRTYRLEEKMNETRLINSWEKVLGKMIAKHTKSLYIHHKTLFVKLDSSALRNELSYTREKIIKALNSEVNAQVITDVVFS